VWKVFFGIVLAIPFLSSPAYGDLFSSVQITASIDSDPMDRRNNATVTGSCSSMGYWSASCGFTLTSGQNTGQVGESATATYGSISAKYGESLSPGPDPEYNACGYVGCVDGEIAASLSAGFLDDIVLQGGRDYAFAQVTIAGTMLCSGNLEGGPSPCAPPNLYIGSNNIELSPLLNWFSVSLLTTDLLPLPGNQFELGLTVFPASLYPFTIPSGEYELSAQIQNIQFFDRNQNPISGFSYYDGSGTLYPIDGGVYATPEPSSIIFLGMVVIGIGFAAKRRFSGSMG
jgi:hypothetical protein